MLQQTPNETVLVNGYAMQTRLGMITVYEKNIYKFESKILGFYDDETYVVSPMPGAPEDSPFFILQSLEHADTCFILLNSTFQGDPNIGSVPPLLLKHDVEHVAQQLCEDSLQYAFVVSNNTSMKSNMSINTMAPVFFSPEQRKGWQIILNNPMYNVCEPLS